MVVHTEQKIAEELAFDTQVKVLARRIAHVDVHGADGDALPWVGNRAVRTVGVIGRTDGIRV